MTTRLKNFKVLDDLLTVIGAEEWFYKLGDVESYADYLLAVLRRRSLRLEALLKEIISHTTASARRVVRSFKPYEDVFKLRAYVLGPDVALRSGSGIQVPIRLATNPALLVRNGSVVLYLRLSSLEVIQYLILGQGPL